jgi:hypothetical protein
MEESPNIAGTSALLVHGRGSVLLEGIQKFSGGSGYVASLSLASGAFALSAHRFYFQRLDVFTENLQEAYDRLGGEARLEYVNETDFLHFEFQDHGHALITGEFSHHAAAFQKLVFALECDQSCFPDFLQALKQVRQELAEP